MLTDEQIARVTHEANRAYCAALGDLSQPAWDEAPEWQRASALNGVRLHRTKPGASARDSHDSWYAEKLAAGWRFGPVKDPVNKEHPCMVPYEDLPLEQQRKDDLFRSTVHALM